MNIRESLRKYIINRRKGERLSLHILFVRVEIGNFLVAISTTGLMALGVIPLSLPILLTLAGVLVILGITGRYIDSVEDDIERDMQYEQHLTENIDRTGACTPCTKSVQQQDY